MKTYSVTYRRDPDDDAWLVEVDGLADLWRFGTNARGSRGQRTTGHRGECERRATRVELDERFAAGSVG